MRQSGSRTDADRGLNAAPFQVHAVSHETGTVSCVNERVLIVDSDSATCSQLGTLLDRHGISVRCFNTAQSLLDAQFGNEVACLVIAVELPDLDGVALLERLNQTERHVPAIVLASGGDVPTAVRAIRARAVDFLEKPVVENLLLKRIRQILEQRNDAG
jgi:FixJ family two-component response regulator